MKAKKKSYKQTDLPPIEKGIPTPPVRHKHDVWQWVYKMRVDDSVFLDSRRYAKGAVSSMRNHIAHNRPNWELTARTYDDGVRVWRTK